MVPTVKVLGRVRRVNLVKALQDAITLRSEASCDLCGARRYSLVARAAAATGTARLVARCARCRAERSVGLWEGNAATV
ncbi:MAG TPA: hypothetical protein VLA99_06795 [Nitrospiraceae bacterium]|nr:hypothetical protein [Nitrospiraceae bacterium]